MKKKIISKTHKILQTNIWSILETYTPPPKKKRKTLYTVWNDQNLKKKNPKTLTPDSVSFLCLHADTTERELFPNKNFPLVNLSITDCLNASKIAK